MNVYTLSVRHKSQHQGLVVEHGEVINSQYSVVNSGEKKQSAEGRAHGASTTPSSLAPNTKHQTPLLVGRDAELAYLRQLLDTAMTGERQIVFVTGEPGIGKTTLVDIFLSHLRERDDVRITSGQCVEQYGPGEAYMPLLEATMKLCRGPGREQVLENLHRYAPSWLVQLPALLDATEYVRLQARVQGTSRERMLREMAEATELFTSDDGLVVVMEDLHWSDVSTLEWLSYIAQRRETAKLLIIGTYRPVEMLTNGRPSRGIVQDLSARGRCVEVKVAPLGESVVQEYVAQRCSGTVPPPELVAAIHRRTEGNPLFVRAIVDYLFTHGEIHESEGQWHFHTDRNNVTTGVPDTIRQLIENQIERAPGEVQQILEVASMVGVEFTVAEVAAGLQSDSEPLEFQCERLAQTGQFLRMEGIAEWPDGTLSSRYSFLHAVYREVIATRVGGTRGIHWHRRIAERKEVAYGERGEEIAAELAAHFEQGRDLVRAIHYQTKAGEIAMRRNAPQEAIAHFSRGLALLATFPDTPERQRQELGLQVALGSPLQALKGYSAPEVEAVYMRARALCQQIGETPQLFSVIFGLAVFYLTTADFKTARELSEQLMRLAAAEQNPALLSGAHWVHSMSLLYLGEIRAAEACTQDGLACYNPQQHDGYLQMYAQDVVVATLAHGTWSLWLLGFPDQALTRAQAARALAENLAHPLTLSVALHFLALLHQFRRDNHAALERADEAIAFAHEQEFPFWLAMATMIRGGALAEQNSVHEGIALMRQGLAMHRATGADIGSTYWAGLVAEHCGKQGHVDEGLEMLAEAFALLDRNGERWWEAELYRLRGELMLAGVGGWGLGAGEEENHKAQGTRQKSENLEPQFQVLDHTAEAEGYFQKAIAIARQQHAKSLELRASVSLARLWQRQNKVEQARELLQAIYDWFTEGFDTKDVQEAEALLVTLGGQGKTEEERQKSKVKVQKSKVTDLRPLSPALLFSNPQPQTPNPQHPVLGLQFPASNTFRSEGKEWMLSFASESCRLKDARGLHYIAQLLQQPHQEVHVLTLITAGADSGEDTGEGELFHDGNGLGAQIEGASAADEILDPRARAAYKQRLSELREELTEAERFHDVGRRERIAAEIDFLTHELTRAIGLGGRARRMGSPAERARVSITRAVKLALRKISDQHPMLGQHLAATIKTGTYCSYVPDERLSVTWQW